jgi:RNA polymerase sigma-70 factor (ECF subfamily)
MLQQEIWHHFAETIEHLPHKQKQSLILFYFHQLTYEEIAKILNISSHDVKISIYRGKQKMRHLWKENSNES